MEVGWVLIGFEAGRSCRLCGGHRGLIRLHVAGVVRNLCIKTPKTTSPEPQIKKTKILNPKP